MYWVLSVFAAELREVRLLGGDLLPGEELEALGEVRVAAILSIFKTIGNCHHMNNGDTLSLLMISSVTRHDQGLACPPLADLAMGAPARGGIPLSGQGLGHLVDHKLYDELLVFILVVTNEWHGGAHHLGEEKEPSEERGSKCIGGLQ